MTEVKSCLPGITRLPNGRWPKGISGNPSGEHIDPAVQELKEAIRIVRKRKGNKSLLIHALERAYQNDQVLIAILKKIIPDKIAGNFKGEGFGDKIITFLYGTNGHEPEFIKKLRGEV